MLNDSKLEVLLITASELQNILRYFFNSYKSLEYVNIYEVRGMEEIFSNEFETFNSIRCTQGLKEVVVYYP